MISGVPINATEEECQTLGEGYKSLAAGLHWRLDQLADYLAKAEFSREIVIGITTKS